MKQLKKEVKSLIKELKTLTRKAEKISARLGALEKVAASKAKTKAVKAKAVPKRKGTATEKVWALINRSRKGIGMAALKEKTGFGDVKIRNIVFRLKKQGKIKSVRPGTYTKA